MKSAAKIPRVSRLATLLALPVLLLAPPACLAFENLTPTLSSQQQACFSLAMIGMDSVINSRLGVPPEHALELSKQSNASAIRTGQVYDQHLLNVILDAYLWQDTPHGYAIKVFYNCAVRSSYANQAQFSPAPASGR